MQPPSQQMIQIRWHGRGGQGAITAAKVVAEATATSEATIPAAETPDAPPTSTALEDMFKIGGEESTED